MDTCKPRPSSRIAITILTPLICFALSMPVSAQIEEITVTATKREENVQDVAVAVSVLSSDVIENAHAVGMEGLATLVPSVSFRKGNTTRNSTVFIRGVGTISFSTAAEPSVSTVVDGVVLGRSGQAFGDLYDLERVEVLRGPQGTLFGKNASAGVVNMTTRKPTEEFEGYIDLSYFEGNETRVKGRVSGPMGDKARGSLTVFKGDFDGYVRNVFNNETTSGYDRSGFRAMLEYDASDSIRVLFIAEDYSASDECCADIEGLPSGRNPASEAAPNSQGVVNGVADIDLDQRLIDHDLTTMTLDDTSAFSITLDADVGDMVLTSITAQRTWNNTEIREGDFTSIAGDSDQPVFGVPFQLHDVGPQEWRQLSQELRLASPGGETFDWQIGAFFWNIDSERNFTRDASCQNNGGQNDAILAANPGLTCNANDIVAATAYFDTEFNNYAAFGEANWNFTDSLTATLGLRYTYDEISFNHNRRNTDEYGRQGVGVRPRDPNSQFSVESGGYDSNFDGTTDNSNVSGKVGLAWRSDNLGLFYGTYSQGYKGPAFNTFYNMGATDVLPIGAEESDAFELGWKYTGEYIFLNIAVFQTDIQNYQANNFDTSTGVTITRLTNAGDISTKGVEVELMWQPTDNLRFGGGITSVDAVIESFNCPIEPTTGLPPANCSDRSGLDVPFSPDFKYSFYGNWSIPVSWGEYFVNGSLTYTDEQQSNLPSNDGTFAPPALLPDYTLLNLNAGVSIADDALRITIIGKNLTDESFVTTYSGDGFRYQLPRDADRYFGLNLRANF